MLGGDASGDQPVSERPSLPLVAGVELGGTKIVCILASGPDTILERVRIPTTTPEATLAAVEGVLDGWSGFQALGIASFGPVHLDREAADYGRIAVTPKPGWAGTDVAGRIARRYRLPTGFHTDVVGAALAEARWGAAAGLADMAYVTVGTGIGVGLVRGGVPVDGLSHAELGHVRPPRLRGDDWLGICPFHGACVEGLASGPAIAARAGTAAAGLPAEHPVWDGVAHALGQLCATLALTGVPRRIVMGGGVMMGAGHLFARIHAAMAESLNGYLAIPELAEPAFLVPPRLGDDAGPLGAVVLGQQALAAHLAELGAT